MIEMLGDGTYKIKGKNAIFSSIINPRDAIDVEIPKGTKVVFDDIYVEIESEKYRISLKPIYSEMTLQEIVDFTTALGDTLYEEFSKKYRNIRKVEVLPSVIQVIGENGEIIEKIQISKICNVFE